MPIKRSYLKTKNICRVTFSLDDKTPSQVCVVGDFNGWDKESVPMKKGKQGFSTTLDLKPGQEYQFRYFIDGKHWANDDGADGFCGTPFSDAQNCILRA